MFDTDKTEFWQQRIKEAQKKHHIVYYTTDDDWSLIQEKHREIIRKEGQGKILDAGCGYGRLAEFITSEQYVGVDFSPDLIELAKKEYPQHVFVVADIAKLPFQDKEFDVCFCASIRHMVISNSGKRVWNRMQKEMQRVAKKVIVLEYTTPDQYTIL